MTASSIKEMDFKKRDLQLSWEAFKLEFKIFMKATDLDVQADSKEVAVLLLSIGSDGRNIFTSFGIDMEKISLDSLIKRFDSHFSSKRNITMERHNFLSFTQFEMSMEQYITALKYLSFSCNFKELREDLIKSVFICGIHRRHNDIKEKLLTE